MNDVKYDDLILVPFDFSPLAFQAMGHGAYMSKVWNSRLALLHVAEKEDDIIAVNKKMGYVAEECMDDFGVLPEVIVRHGSQPYLVIKSVAVELNPALVILKTAGGVYTVTILAGTSIPFLVIQGPPDGGVMKNISFPINFLNKHDEKLKRLILFNDYYPDAVMHIITPSGKGTVKEKNVAFDVSLTRRVLDNQGIKTNFITHDKEKNTAEVILELSKGSDMIVTQIENSFSFSKFLSKYLFGLREKKLITNVDKIPVLCFNQEMDLKREEGIGKK